MNQPGKKILLGAAALFIPLLVAAQGGPMSFFVTSVGSGKGGDLGGLAGADAHCKALAVKVGAGERDWHAYLSTESVPGKRGVSARDRIGSGPWFNAKGVLIAKSVTDLHLYNRTITLNTALNEKGEVVNGRGANPNMHDILTGSQDDGTSFFADDADHTCNNWTSSGEGSAMVGHHDRHGGGNTSWGAAHHSRGCSQADLEKNRRCRFVLLFCRRLR